MKHLLRELLNAALIKVKGIVKELDSSAFVVFHALSGAEGGMVKAREFH